MSDADGADHPDEPRAPEPATASHPGDGQPSERQGRHGGADRRAPEAGPGQQPASVDAAALDRPVVPPDDLPAAAALSGALSAPDASQGLAPGPESTPAPPSGGLAMPRLNADIVDLSRGGVGIVQAREFRARLSGVGAVLAGKASVTLGSVGAIVAREATVGTGVASTVVAADAHVERALVRTVVASTVHVGPSTGIFLVVARRVDGSPKALLDWRGALAIGGVVLALAVVGRRQKR